MGLVYVLSRADVVALQYVGLKLAAKKDVKCIKAQQFDAAHGVRAAVLEKSQDCAVRCGCLCLSPVASRNRRETDQTPCLQKYARVAEFPDFPLTYTQEKAFPLPALDEGNPTPLSIATPSCTHLLSQCRRACSRSAAVTMCTSASGRRWPSIIAVGPLRVSR